MSVNVLHHGMCFDGAASAALFTAFLRRQAGAEGFRYIPKDHCPGDPYVNADFDADEVVGLDFRYSQDARMTRFFDHHRSAFQLAGDREHFEADRSGRKFHDASARSCAGYIARVVRAEVPLAEMFGYAGALGALTHGAGRFVLEASRYAAVAAPPRSGLAA